MSFELIATNGESNLTVFNPGEVDPLQIHSSHPNFSKVLEICLGQQAKGVDEAIDASLFDTQEAINEAFRSLSERVTARGGKLYFDGDAIDDSLANHILRALADDDVDEYEPWVNFLESLYVNPDNYIRNNLFEWLRAEDFTITKNGDIVGYKYVYSDEEHGYVSGHAGTAYVDGVVFEDQKIPNPVGAVITMPRSEVDSNENMGCSVGLHIGTYDFASGYGDALLEIHFKARDVVSVPRHASYHKVRASRYVVVGPIENGQKFSEPLREAVEAPAENDGHPDPAEWTDLVTKAKRQKKGVPTLGRKKGWTLQNAANPKDRLSWTV